MTRGPFLAIQRTETRKLSFFNVSDLLSRTLPRYSED